MFSRFYQKQRKQQSAHGKKNERGSAQEERGSAGVRNCHNIFSGGSAKRKFKKVCEKYDRGGRRCAKDAVKNNRKCGKSHSNVYERGSDKYKKERALVGRKCHQISSGGGGKRNSKKAVKKMTEAEADALNILSKAIEAAKRPWKKR